MKLEGLYIGKTEKEERNTYIPTFSEEKLFLSDYGDLVTI